MSRKSQQRSVMYNRQSKGWQQNQMKKQMADAGYAKGMPKVMETSKLRKLVITVAVIWFIITVLVTIKFSWVGLFICLGIGTILTVGLFAYTRGKEREILKAYKTMGYPREEFFKQMKKASKQPLTKKQLEKLKKTWDRV